MTTYSECLDVPGPNASIAFLAFADGLKKRNEYSTIKDLLEFFETNYNCAGVCEKALFYFSKSIELGRPT